MASSNIICEQLPAVALVRINQPERCNALSENLINELTAVFTHLKSDVGLRAVILTGVASKFAIDSDASESANALKQPALIDLIEAFPVPVIAAINGIASGLGCELALACHLRLAASDASFSLPKPELSDATNDVVRRLMRYGRDRLAFEMLLTGRAVPADEAYRVGLINKLSAPDSLLTDAEVLANEIAQLAPLAIRACLRAVTEGLALPLEEGLARETELFARLFATNDMREGTRSFLEKRRPVFNGT